MFPVELPAELVVIIISYLPLTSITRLQRVNHRWHECLISNENSVYRNAAWREGWLTTPQILLEDLDRLDEVRSCYSKRSVRDVSDWKGFCRRRKAIQRSWAGRAPSEILSSPRNISTPLPPNERQRNPSRRVHRIKVDEKVGIVMTTSAVGGFIVRDLESDEILWELPVSYVHSYAHLEYDEGYVIFDRDDGNKEIWRRTEITEASSLTTSFPDSRQLQMAVKLETSSSDHPHAQFSPYAVISMPEITRAYRFVYPNLLVASLERAYIWDVRTGELIQTLESIQIVHPFGPDTSLPISDDEGHGTENSTSYHSDSESDQLLAVEEETVEPVDPLEQAFETDTDQEEEEDEENNMEMLPRFLGLIRYVEISARHVVIVGRYLIRVFSRATGKAVLDLPSTMQRYGAARWEVRSRDWAMEEIRKGTGTGDVDTYDSARREGRELVRLPLQFTYEPYRNMPKLLIDQFVAAHVSRDGKHLVTMLSGSRILVIHYFEALCDALANIASTPASKFLPRATEIAGTVDPTQASNIAIPSTPTKSSSRRLLSAGEQREIQKRVKRERDKTVFEHTLDLQLGSPQASSSVYLAYENGRIGVVTTNSVYVVAVDLPAVPQSYSSAGGIGFVPGVRVTRVPYFSNPSWLAAVSCLMMSDTGLYLNWNPCSPPPPLLPPPNTAITAADDSSASRLGETIDELLGYGPGGIPWYMQVEDPQERSYRHQQERVWAEWDSEYEAALEAYEIYEGERYHELPSGDMLVSQNARVLIGSDVSTVYSVDFSVADKLGQ